MTIDIDNDETTTTDTKTRKTKTITGTAAAAENAAGDATEKLVIAAANARRPLKTPKGTMIRMDFLGESLQGHPEEGACDSDPCPKCKHSRSVRLTSTNEIKPNTSISWHDVTFQGEFSYSPSGLSMTPRVERRKSFTVEGYARKVIQTCNCGQSLGHVWQYAPECHGLTLVQLYHRF
jgi:hypothetical protein